MLTPETILQGRYRIIRQLGQGGMGAVYEAVDQRLDTTVALKETLFSDERLRRQFEREARLLARLHHPALPRVSDHFSEGDGQFLVMQYIPGDDLSEMMTHRKGPFPPSQVLSWADQLLDALDYLHTQEPQIIHRDIKPQNLKLTSRGQIILLDFGLAKGQSGDISRVTTAASIFGYTPNYAPLEQIQGLGTDLRSDLYSLAATMYHLLTGVKPPDALSRAAALVNGQEDPLLVASEANPAAGTQADQVLKKAMSQNREQRYGSADEMRKALHAGDQAATIRDRAEAQTVLFKPSAATAAPSTTEVVAQQPTVAAGETTVVRRGVSGGGRRTLPWALSIAALVIVAVGVLGVAWKIRRSSEQLAPSPAPAPVETPSVAPSASPEATVAETSTPETAKRERKEQVAKKAEKSTSDSAPKPTPPSRAEDAERHTDPMVEVEVPEAPTRPSPMRRPQRGLPNVKVLPDGSTLITAPDGTRILTTPDGRRQIFRPPNTRQRRPPPATPSPRP
ncbi:MAG TPA: protein kinase [Pyrinomonadaceae bacterium]|nr:protein kinase [Pyrinomonadaceae bacterium]